MPLFNVDDDNSNYLDAQGLGPGSGYAYWINFGGSGNRNKTSGDAIFHCHFYPHFAQGMWEMWRNHDMFEPGTELQAVVQHMFRLQIRWAMVLDLAMAHRQRAHGHYRIRKSS